MGDVLGDLPAVYRNNLHFLEKGSGNHGLFSWSNLRCRGECARLPKEMLTPSLGRIQMFSENPQ